MSRKNRLRHACKRLSRRSPWMLVSPVGARAIQPRPRVFCYRSRYRAGLGPSSSLHRVYCLAPMGRHLMIKRKNGRFFSPRVLPNFRPLRYFTTNISYPQSSPWAFCSSLLRFAALCWVGVAQVEIRMMQEQPLFGGHH